MVRKKQVKALSNQANRVRRLKDKQRRSALAEATKREHAFVRDALSPVITLSNAIEETTNAREAAAKLVSELGGFPIGEVELRDGPSPHSSTHSPGLYGDISNDKVTMLRYSKRFIGDREFADGISTAQKLLRASGRDWDGSLVASDFGPGLNKLRAETTTEMDGKGGVSVSTKFTGSLAQLVGLSVARCHVEPYRKFVESYLGQCANPACRKWYFSDKRKVSKVGKQGHRKHCCAGCENVHRQLRLSDNYEQRLRAGDYVPRPCERCG
jgi:hypothetical protein